MKTLNIQLDQVDIGVIVTALSLEKDRIKEAAKEYPQKRELYLERLNQINNALKKFTRK